ncbi:penicillin-binding protein 2 [Hyphomonadaceae bacterium BL14]|nr:penicillin-binding protein 2 [Hyphomonadaceae bacterium BL14]
MGSWRRKIRAINVRTQPRRAAPGERAPAGMSRQVHVAGGRAGQEARQRGRLRIAGLVLAAGFIIVAARALDVSLVSGATAGPGLQAAGEATVRRAALTDRHGQVLASTLDFHAAYANGQHIPRELVDETVARLQSVLPDIDAERMAARMRARNAYILIADGLTPRARQSIHHLGLPGVYFQTQPGRVYPRQSAAAHVVGYAGREMRGLSGAELAFDAELNDPSGRPVALSIDLTAQHRVESVLAEHMARHQAQGAAAILMRVGTGEVIAMASLPDYDVNRYTEVRPSAADGVDPRFNRASVGVYELGSVFKPLALAAGLESGRVALDDLFDVRQPLRVAGHSIDDFRGQRRELTAREVIIHSSNIGSALMARQMGAETLRPFYEALRLHERPPLELSESAHPRMPRNWGRTETMTAAFGHGLAVSPLALTSAYAALANGGVYVPPTLRPVAPGEIIAGDPVMSARTAAQVLAVMRETVARSQAGGPDVEGLAVAGKTGTALQAGPGGYDRDHRVTTFVAVFPFDDPQYVLTVTFDRPRPSRATHGFATAGWNAAPAAGDILRQLAGVLELRRRDADPSARAEQVAALFAPRVRAVVPSEEPVLLTSGEPQ